MTKELINDIFSDNLFVSNINKEIKIIVKNVLYKIITKIEQDDYYGWQNNIAEKKDYQDSLIESKEYQIHKEYYENDYIYDNYDMNEKL